MEADKAACHNMSKTFFEINEGNGTDFILMLEVLFIHKSEVEDMFHFVPSGSEPGQLLSSYLFGLGFKHIQNNFQHDFARVTDEADGSVVLAEL